MVFNSIEEAQRSTDPAKLFRAMRVCSTDAHREIALGFHRGAYLSAMCSVHYANRFLRALEALPVMTCFQTSDMTVAQTILAQLGGQRFLTMTGAKFLLAHASALSFHLPSNFAKDGINRVRIDLTAQDLYDVTFSRARGIKIFYQSKVDGLYCDQLREVFTEATGLEVALHDGRMERASFRDTSDSTVEVGYREPREVE